FTRSSTKGMGASACLGASASIALATDAAKRVMEMELNIVISSSNQSVSGYRQRAAPAGPPSAKSLFYQLGRKRRRSGASSPRRYDEGPGLPLLRQVAGHEVLGRDLHQLGVLPRLAALLAGV